MSSGYEQYGGNPYGYSGQGGYGASNPYGRDVEQGGYNMSNLSNQPTRQTVQSDYSATSNYSRPTGATGTTGTTGAIGTTGTAGTIDRRTDGYSASQANAGGYGGGYGEGHANNQAAPYGAPQQRAAPLTTNEFLAEIDRIRASLATHKDNVEQVSTMQRGLLTSNDQNAQVQLDRLMTDTQAISLTIKNTIKSLERDVAADPSGGQAKKAQLGNVKNTFKEQLETYQRNEVRSREEYRNQVARQYRVANPEATDEEVREAQDADWGNQSVYANAVRFVPARHAAR